MISANVPVLIMPTVTCPLRRAKTSTLPSQMAYLDGLYLKLLECSHQDDTQQT